MKHMKQTKQWILEAQVGRLYLVASERGLQGIYWTKQPVPMAKSLAGNESAVKFLAQAAQELTEYFEGTRKKFKVRLDPQGTEFQRQVWAELSRIPYGRTRSYAEIAAAVGKPKAVRAVGTANGRNPLCIIVPCHRVIASDGSLGGYSGGLKLKSSLLRLELRTSPSRGRTSPSRDLSAVSA